MANILQSNQFKKIYKKLHKNIRDSLNNAIKEITINYKLGEEKKGDLKGVYVYKFKYKIHLYLLAYRVINSKTIILESFGSHENFYKNMRHKY